MTSKIVIVGLGYVGLPLAVSAGIAGFEVVGIDTNEDKVDLINRGISPIKDISDIQIKKLLSSGLLRASNLYQEAEQAEIILICVPTPLDFSRSPDTTFVESAARSLSKVISKGCTVILESTVAPGTTRDILAPIFFSSPKIGNNGIEIAYSPERIDPSNNTWKIENTPKIVAGLTSKSRELAKNFYSKFINEIIECDSVEIAETSKLLENSFRLVNISFINELAIFCQKTNIDVNKVIAAASTKPYGFMPFYPGLGAGGHCIPVDPIYLAHAFSRAGISSRLINLADRINQEMPEYFVARAESILGDLKDKKVLVIGISYKQNVADIRESPVINLINGLELKGAKVSWNDDLVKEWKGQKSVPLSSKFDLAIIATPHKNLNLDSLEEVPILNTLGSN